jgi:hypothetical protein
MFSVILGLRFCTPFFPLDNGLWAWCTRHMDAQTRHPTVNYADESSTTPFVRLEIRPRFSPVDLNLLFVARQGWAAGDRLRIAIAEPEVPPSGPLGELLGRVSRHVLLRRYDRDEDAFVSVRLLMDGRIIAESNDANFARKYIAGLLLECSPSFHSLDDVEISETWIRDDTERAMFLGMLHGALGWDPSHQVPPAIGESLEEARKALAVANYRSCVTMCRRVVEAVLKFAHERLLKSKPLDKAGKSLMLNALIERFRKEGSAPIPAHLLHLADALRVVGNVPGAHAAEIPNYQFTATDAEFALATAHYFVDQYFAKIDTDVNTYFVLTVDPVQHDVR